MTIRVVRMTALAIYIWMLGLTIMLAGVATHLTPGPNAPEVMMLGLVFMVAGIIYPVPRTILAHNEQRGDRAAESNGGAGE